jgi:type I restriction enzyme M protein
MEACVVICRNNKPAKRRGKVIFIDGVKEVQRERTMSFLLPVHQEKIANAYHDFKDIEGFACVATLKEIQANGGNLNVPLYVRGHVVRDEQGKYDANGLEEAISNWQESSEKLSSSVNELLNQLEEK